MGELVTERLGAGLHGRDGGVLCRSPLVAEPVKQVVGLVRLEHFVHARGQVIAARTGKRTLMSVPPVGLGHGVEAPAQILLLLLQELHGVSHQIRQKREHPGVGEPREDEEGRAVLLEPHHVRINGPEPGQILPVRARDVQVRGHDDHVVKHLLGLADQAEHSRRDHVALVGGDGARPAIEHLERIVPSPVIWKELAHEARGSSWQRIPA